MTRKLTAKQEIFCNAFVETGNASEAYRRAYGPKPNMLASSVWSRASQIMADVKVVSRVAELQAAAAENACWNAEKVLAELDRVIAVAREEGDLASQIRALELIAKHLGMFCRKAKTPVVLIMENHF